MQSKFIMAILAYRYSRVCICNDVNLLLKTRFGLIRYKSMAANFLFNVKCYLVFVAHKKFPTLLISKNNINLTHQRAMCHISARHSPSNKPQGKNGRAKNHFEQI